MRTRPPTRREDVRDPIGLAGWPRDKGRDGERTPMQLDAGQRTGFTRSSQPWLPVGGDYRTVNVEQQWRDPASLLRWTARLIGLRRVEPALRDGAMTLLPGTGPDGLAWTRTGAGASVLVAPNMGGHPRALAIPDGAGAATLAFSDPAAFSAGARIVLPPLGSWVGRITNRTLASQAPH